MNTRVAAVLSGVDGATLRQTLRVRAERAIAERDYFVRPCQETAHALIRAIDLTRKYDLDLRGQLLTQWGDV